MHSTHKFIVSIVLLITASQPALAVQMRTPDAPTPASAKPTTGVIERGGTVTSFDPVKKIVVVDMVPFALNATPVKIHHRGAANDKNFVLKPGMQIRFNTSKANFSAQDKVLEIWVTKLDSKPVATPKPTGKLVAK